MFEHSGFGYQDSLFDLLKKNSMIPTREQFKDFIAAIKKAQEKEEKVNESNNKIKE